MRTQRIISGTVLLFLAVQILSTGNVFTQNRPDCSAHTTAPLPDLLLSSDKGPVKSVADWEQFRREEVLELFREHVYGRVPDAGFRIDHQLIYFRAGALDGKAVQKEVKVTVYRGGDSHSFTILIFLPKEHQEPVPLFVGLNFYGNHTIHPDSSISLTDSWLRNNESFGITDHLATDASRGVRRHRWPVEAILDRGYGLATIYSGDIDPDTDDGFINGIHKIDGIEPAARDSSSWGTIAAWAWGLSRAMDYFETDSEIDHKRVAVMGHSRLGKTSLWAGAQDRRFALVISNNSGCGGAALSRRNVGESVSRINEVFPHWFASRFHSYGEEVAALPVDQHMLMALAAPRPLYVASAAEDQWADPYGEYLSLYCGSAVYQLYGNDPLESDLLPEVNEPRWNGKLGYHIRSGKHDVTVYDWERFLDFADLHLKEPHPGFPGNPVTEEWVRQNIRDRSPRLILTPELECQVTGLIERGDRATVMGWQLLERTAEAIMEEDPLVYQKKGRRLLGISREALRRLSTLAMVYRIGKDEGHLRRLEEELKAVISFPDWNPSHFLDVAEMAAGISLALDWAGEWIQPDLAGEARKALITKALAPSVEENGNNWWVVAHHNWNLVCHGGLSLAALTVFEQQPELSTAVLKRAVDHIPLALKPYAPDGVYPEGPSYWFYATSYLATTLSAFESALGTGFGFRSFPGVAESAEFSRVLAGPSGDYYNFFDSGLDGYHSLTHFGLLSWFAINGGTTLDWDSYLERLENRVDSKSELRGNRLFPVWFLNAAGYRERLMKEGPGSGSTGSLEPAVWTAGGEEPVLVFRDPVTHPRGFFLAAKGGRAADNHGNMDAGSFIFELDGVRWSVDPGNQSYHQLEQLMGEDLWDSSQESGRWSLLTKNNFGHSTLTINGELHLSDARATLMETDRRSDTPHAAFELTPLFGELVESAYRTFSRLPGDRLLIRDEIECTTLTRQVRWQMMTTASVRVKDSSIILEQEGESLQLRITSSHPYRMKVVKLSPPPLSFDKDIPGLKRIEVTFQGCNPGTGRLEIQSELGRLEGRIGEWKDEKPNFLWIVSEDNSKHYLKLFDSRGIATPNIEEMANHGVCFTRAFSNAPVCSVARSTLISSCFGPRTGAQYHRKSFPVPLPGGVVMFPALLRMAGYYTTNRHKEDYNYVKTPGTWDESSRKAHWKARASGQPFFHMESHPVSHESSLHFPPSLQKTYTPVTGPQEVHLFPQHPDTDLFRFTAAYYRDRILSVDTIVGMVIRELEEEGVLEETFVFYFGDHGGVLPGSKGYAYETGLHVPLVVRIPEKFKHLVDLDTGSISEGFVSFTDYGPTLLRLAGIGTPDGVDGKPFMGPGITSGDLNKRNITYGYADRFDEKYDQVRTVRKGRFKYIRSYQPFIPDGLQNNYRYRCAAFRQWRDMFRNGALNEVQSAFFLPREPEALFDLEQDPYETVNLAGDPALADTLREMRMLLTGWVKGMPDLSFYPESYLRSHASGQPTDFGRRHRGQIARLIDIADLALLPFSGARQELEDILSSDDPLELYWGLIVCSTFGREAEPFYKRVLELTAHGNLLVRTRAAEFLGLTGEQDPSEVITGALLECTDDLEAALILNTIVLLMDGPFRYEFPIDESGLHPGVLKGEQVKRRLEYLDSRRQEAKMRIFTG